MLEDPQEALAVVASAVRELLENSELVAANPGERALVGVLPALLAGKFPDWTVSVEWDRFEQEIKRLRYQISDDKLERVAPIIPDLIVHRIGKKENLLVVEVKRSVNRDYEGDIWKLRGMTQQSGQYAYAAGLHLVLNMPEGKVERCDVYIDAEVHPGLTDWLRQQLP